MFYLHTSDISLFPATNKPTDPSSRLTTSYNLTNIVNRLLNVDGFVVNSNLEFIENNYDKNFIEFNLNGYLIRVENLKSMIDAYLYAYGYVDSEGEQLKPIESGKSIYANIAVRYEHVTDNTGNELKPTFNLTQLLGREIILTELETIGGEVSTVPPGYSSVVFTDGSSKSYTLDGVEQIATNNPFKYDTEADQENKYSFNWNDETCKFYTLKLLQFDGTKWFVPATSKVRFNQTSIGKLDDGDLDDSTTLYN